MVCIIYVTDILPLPDAVVVHTGSMRRAKLKSYFRKMVCNVHDKVLLRLVLTFLRFIRCYRNGWCLLSI